MKNLIATILLLSLSSTQAQNVSDYKYVIVPQKFADFEKNDYNLNSKLKMLLRKKNYVIIAEGVTEKPEDLQFNQCLATKVDIKELKDSFKNKLEVIFTNCNQKIVGTYQGVSKIKDFEEGFEEALQLATAQINKQNAKAIPEVMKVEQIPIVSNSTNTVNNSKTNTYTQNGNIFILASTTNGEFLLVNQNDSKVIAQFYPSSQKNVYHVEVISEKGNYKTIGFLTTNSINIDYQTGEKNWTPTIFTKQ